MASDTPASRESQEQSIKARKKELFQAEPPPAASAGARKSIQEYLRDTRANPMGRGVKAALWVAAVLVVVLFLASLLTSGSRPRRRAPRPRSESRGRAFSPIAKGFPTSESYFLGISCQTVPLFAHNAGVRSLRVPKPSVGFIYGFSSEGGHRHGGSQLSSSVHVRGPGAA
jgi:hypothetical protein